ncbi:high mobility group box domain-containing protein, partial [Dichomitus squalens]
MPRAPTHRETERDSQQEKIPRPPNAWILYRTDLLNQWKANRSPHEPPSRQSDISRLVSARWKAEDSAIKLEYEKRAAIAKAEHKKRYPDYKYTP